MKSFIRELYYSDFCEVSKSFRLSDEGISASIKLENIYEELADHIEKNDLALLDEYIQNTNIVRSDETFHAYVSGMSDFIHLITSVLDEQ